jgi:hypothetical protein
MGLKISSDVAWGQAASGLRGKIARKRKAEEGGGEIHRVLLVKVDGGIVNVAVGKLQSAKRQIPNKSQIPKQKP